MEENHNRDPIYKQVNIYIKATICKGGGTLSKKYDQKRNLLYCLKAGIKDITL